MRPALVFGVLVLIGTLGLGGLWLRAVDALAPRVLDSRAVERAMNKTLNNFEAVLQGHRHMVQPPASQGPTTTRSAPGVGTQWYLLPVRPDRRRTPHPHATPKRGRGPLGRRYASASSSALASWRSAVSNPSVNQP